MINPDYSPRVYASKIIVTPEPVSEMENERFNSFELDNVELHYTFFENRVQQLDS